MAKKTKMSPLDEFIKIQFLQEELDASRRERAVLNERIRSISQEIPNRIRGLPLR